MVYTSFLNCTILFVLPLITGKKEGAGRCLETGPARQGRPQGLGQTATGQQEEQHLQRGLPKRTQIAAKAVLNKVYNTQDFMDEEKPTLVSRQQKLFAKPISPLRKSRTT